MILNALSPGIGHGICSQRSLTFEVRNGTVRPSALKPNGGLLASTANQDTLVREAQERPNKLASHDLDAAAVRLEVSRANQSTHVFRFSPARRPAGSIGPWPADFRALLADLLETVS
jgi:hypothetical protein